MATQAAHGAPVRAVVGAGEHGIVEGELPQGRGVRAVGEHDIALAGEALLRQLGGANNDGTTAGEAQVDDGAVACGEVGERGPKWLLEHGDVDEERNREPWLRCRRSRFLCRIKRQ